MRTIKTYPKVDAFYIARETLFSIVDVGASDKFSTVPP